MGKKRTASCGKFSSEFGTTLPRPCGMSEHALAVLEFHRVLEQVAAFRVGGRAEGGAGVTVGSFFG